MTMPSVARPQPSVVVPAMIAVVSARMGTGRVTISASGPHRSSSRLATACSSGETYRETRPAPLLPMAKATSAAPTLPVIESAVPRVIPNSAPCAVITMLDGTGRMTSASSRPTPSAAAPTPPRPSRSDGSMSSGIPSASTTRKLTRTIAAIASAISVYLRVTDRSCRGGAGRALRASSEMAER